MALHRQTYIDSSLGYIFCTQCKCESFLFQTYPLQGYGHFQSKKKSTGVLFFTVLQWPFARPQQVSQLSDNFSNNTRANGTATFADCEAQTFVHCDWVDQGNNHFDVVAWHDHFNAFWQLY